MSARCYLLVLAAGAVLTASADAGAGEPEAGAPRAPTLALEWVGLELTPVSFATSSPPPGRPDTSFSALQGGPGANVRLLRYRWEHAYMIPVAAGLYVSNGEKTIFAHARTEGGIIVPGTDRRLELGAGLAFGILAMPYAPGCDGSCVIGGKGMMALLVARYLFWLRPTVTAGVNLRAFLPLSEPTGSGFGYYTGSSGVIMGALEFGFGRASAAGSSAGSGGGHHPVDD